MADTSLVPGGRDGNLQFAGSLPADPREQLRFVSQMSQGISLSGDDAKDAEIAVQTWLIHPIEMIDEHTGEVIEHQRIVLCDEWDHRVSSLSPGVIHAWGLVVQMMGVGPYEPPIRVAIREGKSRKGLTYRTLVVLD